jgi:hypothetical protein
MGSRWRDIAREYKRQKEKLDLLAQELQIQRDEEAIEWKRAAKKGLQDNLQALESSIRDLEKQWSTRSSHWGWRSWTIAKQLELLRIMSKLKKQRANLVKAREQISATLKSIQEMEASVLAVKSNFESAKGRHRSQWAEEECCKSQIEALSKAVNQLELWKRETSVAKEELKTVTRLLKDCQKQKETYGRDLESIEMKHQTANRRIQEQGADMETVRTKLSSAHKGVRTLLSEVEILHDSLSGIPQHTHKIAPYSLALPTTTGTARNPRHMEDFTQTMSLISDLVSNVEGGRHTIFKTYRDTEKKLKESCKATGEYKASIEQMSPLLVGLATRHRKFELDMKCIKGSRPDWELVNKGNEAAHNGRALADATMFQGFWKDGRPYIGEFEDQYNTVPAKIIWERRGFCMFHDVLSWHMDMKRFKKEYNVESARFDEDFATLFSNIYPSFEVASNEDINKDPLKNADDRLSIEHRAASGRVREIRKNQRKV